MVDTTGGALPPVFPAAGVGAGDRERLAQFT
jgi:hypothetical protein